MTKYPSKFPGKVVVVVYTRMVLPSTIKFARAMGIWLVSPHGEETEFPS